MKLTNRRAQYAIVHPVFLQGPLFKSLVRGPRKKLRLSSSFGEEFFTFSGVEELGIPEQSVLLAVCALCGLKRRVLTPAPESIGAAALRKKLCAKGDLAKRSSTLSAIITVHQLLVASGMPTGGSSYERLSECLVRLSNVTVSTREGSAKSRMRLMAYIPAENGKNVRIAIHWLLARSIVGDRQFSKVDLDERNSLQSDAAQCLHAWLSAFVREKGRLKLGVATAATHIWDGKCSEGATRKRHMKVRNLCVDEIGNLAGWDIKIAGAQAIVNRV